MKCPNCGSEHVQFATKTEGGGFSFFDSCCGFILLGPVGLLCGTCGSDTTTKEFWICHNCGYKFSTEKGKEYLRQEAADASTYVKNKRTLISAGDRSLSDLEAAVSEATANLQEKKKIYQEFVEKYLTGADGDLAKHAQALQQELDGKWALVWLAVFLATFILILGSMPVIVTILCILIDIASAVYLIKYYRALKAANTAFTQADTDYLAAKNAIEEAEDTEKAAKALLKAAKDVKDYEAKHPKEK